MIRKIVSFCAVFFVAAFVFAQRIISPVEGIFNNRQALVIDVADGAECFYSFTGSDPLTSGFAYDGPVLIDASGNISVNVVCLKDDLREEYSVNFTVDDTTSSMVSSSSIGEKEYFVASVVAGGFYNWSSDLPLNIPAEFRYALGSGDPVFLPGQTLKLEGDNALGRYLPCNVTDGTNNWRFIIKIVPGVSAFMAKYEGVPFKIGDWENFTFTGEKLIYCIDDSDWSASRETVTLDRSVAHKIKWQDVAYEHGNPVYVYILPPKPQLNVSGNGAGAIKAALDGNAEYAMKLQKCGVSGEYNFDGGYFTECALDVFAGEEISGEAVFDIYYRGCHQGTISVPVAIDRKPPAAPVIETEFKGLFIRSSVNLTINSKSQGDIFYAVSAPFFVPSEDMTKTEISYPQVEAKNFKKYDKSVRLMAGKNGAVYYKVKAYVKDEAGNVSETTEYSIIIDEYNYYVDSEAKNSLCDGSRNNPFTTLSQAFSVVNGNKFVHFYIKGTFNLSEGEHVISSNVSLTPVGETRIVFPANSTLVIKDAGVEVENIIFEKASAGKTAAGETKEMFVLQNATANVSGCEIVGVFGTSGTVINCQDSVLLLNDCGITAQGQVYSCGINGSESKVGLKNCRVSTVAPTCVNFSLAGGTFDLHNSTCQVNGQIGRIAELSKTVVRYANNSFKGKLGKETKILLPVWADGEVVFYENKNNTVKGF